jgi:hypothetical protein
MSKFLWKCLIFLGLKVVEIVGLLLIFGLLSYLVISVINVIGEEIVEVGWSIIAIIFLLYCNWIFAEEIYKKWKEKK